MKYKKGILVFNILIPIIVIAIALAITGYLKSSVNKKHADREAQLAKSEALETEIETVKGEVQDYRDALKPSWDELLETQVSTQITKTLNNILKNIPNEELKRTGLSIKEGTNEFSKTLTQPSNVVTISFTGTYTAMQKAMSEFETRLPNFQLQSLKVIPSDNGVLLDYQLSYIVWKQTPA